jgi:hypothetical protein
MTDERKAMGELLRGVRELMLTDERNTKRQAEFGARLQTYLASREIEARLRSEGVLPRAKEDLQCRPD